MRGKSADVIKFDVMSEYMAGRDYRLVDHNDVTAFVVYLGEIKIID